ncbi:MAG TPA: PaaI family thioesterase [Pseudonocardia sp.]|nr:PaaI family thioesterase [Pseudonocardia sp.]
MTVPEPVPAESAVRLPAHSVDCYGCGPDNPAGLRMQVWREGDEVYSDVVFQPHHVGAPGIAHGGAVAAACDDLFGFMLYVVREPGVTRSLTMEYRVPTALGASHRITARLNRRDGRKLYLAATGVRADGQLCFTATAVFIVVERAHFERYGVLAEHPGLDALTATPGPPPPGG